MRRRAAVEGGRRIAPDALPWLTAGQMAEVDRRMVEEAGIDLVRMMELAGRALAALARDRFLEGDASGRRVLALAGPGGNGGGAMVAARRLAGWGARVELTLARPPGTHEGVPGEQLAILRRLGMEPDRAGRGGDADARAGPEGRRARPDDGDRAPGLVLDGVLGYGLRGAPRGGAAELVRAALGLAAAGVPVLSLDVPSGVDATSGRAFEPAVRADATLTLALPKTGLRESPGREHAGELWLADIGVPPELYRAPPVGVDPGPLFSAGELLRIGTVPAKG